MKFLIRLSLITLIFSVTVVGQSRFINQQPGFIGINTNNPNSFLTIEGDESAPSFGNDYRAFLRLNNKSNSSSSFAGLEITSGSNSYRTVLQHIASSYYFPGLSEYADFGQLYSRGKGLILRTGSNEYANGVIKFMTGLTSNGGSYERMRITGDGFVGIGTKSPTRFLTIEGDEGYGSIYRTMLLINNLSNEHDGAAILEINSGTGGSGTTLGHHSPSYNFPNVGYEFANQGQLWSKGSGLIIRSGGLATNENAMIRFITGYNSGFGYERMRISGNGNVGIGNNNPTAKLQVTSGDIYITDISRGVILKSPNGNCWRITIDDVGNLQRTQISCP